MLEDQLSDQVSRYRSLPDDQNAGAPLSPVVRMPSSCPWAPLHFGHREGCVRSRLDYSVDLQASRTCYRNPYRKGPKRQFVLNFLHDFLAGGEAALAADLIPASPGGTMAAGVAAGTGQTYIFDRFEL